MSRDSVERSRGIESVSMYSKSSILARPGWSSLNFDRLLGEPDEKRPNRSGPTFLYTPERVEAAEQSALFEEIIRPYEAQLFRIPQTHIFSDDEFADRLGPMEFEVAHLTLGKVAEGAIGHYNARRTSGFASRGRSPEDSARIMVPYARDVLTAYDRKFEKKLEEVAASTALRAIRYTIYRAIGIVYPELAMQCESQYDDELRTSRQIARSF